MQRQFGEQTFIIGQCSQELALIVCCLTVSFRVSLHYPASDKPARGFLERSLSLVMSLSLTPSSQLFSLFACPAHGPSGDSLDVDVDVVASKHYQARAKRGLFTN